MQEMREINIYWGSGLREGNQPTCKAEYWRFTSRKLDSHSPGKRHYYYFADMSQH